MLPPQLQGHRTYVSDNAFDYGIVSVVRMTHVSFTPHRFGALRMINSMTSEDISWPAAFAGKLYRNSGICVNEYLIEVIAKEA
jgi:hypothetical protein